MTRRLFVFCFVLYLAPWFEAYSDSAPPLSRDNGLSIQRLVAGQRDLDRLAWNHRLWPESNPQSKPAFDLALPMSATEQRVLDTRRLISALRTRWNDPLAVSELQNELKRMVRNSKDPARLRERFVALGYDPALIYPLIVEPVVAARRARLAFERDPRSSAARRAELQQQLRRTSGRFESAHWYSIKRERFDDDQWQESRTAVMTPPQISSDGSSSVLELKETTEAFYVRIRADESATTQMGWEASWPKPRFDVWWTQHFSEFEIEPPQSDYGLGIPTLDNGGNCTPDTWEYIASNPPDPRAAMFHVWTGTELLVWGGGTANELFTSGGRYDPSTDTWSQISSGTGVPSTQVQGTAVWTGREMIVWGGRANFGTSFGLNTGARYDPLLDRWTPISTTNAPTPRYRHVAVWTGSEMIVWGGRSAETGTVQTGARYNPVADAWTPTAIDANTPSARIRPAAVWTGNTMFVWSGNASGAYVQDGAVYNPVLNSWQSIPSVGAPAGRDAGLAVWTGTEVVVWGGVDATSARNDGGRFVVSTQSWAPVSTIGAPAARWLHAQVWTGSKMLTWGGSDLFSTIQFGDGGSYDPNTDSWTPIIGDPLVIGPSSRPAYAWSGTELLVWGGDGEGTGTTIGGKGGRYNPNTGAWTQMGGRGTAPGRRTSFTPVWDGNAMLIWGGADEQGYTTYSDGFSYDPATDAWLPMSGSGAPSSRYFHRSVWTGRELIVWGGRNQPGPGLGDGGRFDPATNSWVAIPVSSNSPSARDGHSAVWTGTEMIVWGGNGKTGARFNPSTGSWVPTSVTADTAKERGGHSAVWGNAGMMIYGGRYQEGANGPNNARYVPATDSWTPMAEPPPPAPQRRDCAAVWDGSRMLVWGGYGFSLAVNTAQGLGYSPTSDTWTVLGAGPNTPTARDTMLHVWDGESLLIWGGDNYPLTRFLADGSRYVSATDSWLPMTTVSGVPEARNENVGVFSGTHIYLWGGSRENTGIGQGAAYCRCAGTNIYRDADGDGWGDPLLTQASCVVPVGYVTSSGDCNDANGAIHPGATELCDLVDNDCDQVIDNVSRPTAVLNLQVAGNSISWGSVSTATGYDALRGDVGSLLTSSGNFAVSLISCLANDTTTTSISDPQIPVQGAAAYYLARALNCGGLGSYDEPPGGQSGSRDTEIASSEGACP